MGMQTIKFDRKQPRPSYCACASSCLLYGHVKMKAFFFKLQTHMHELPGFEHSLLSFKSSALTICICCNMENTWR